MAIVRAKVTLLKIDGKLALEIVGVEGWQAEIEATYSLLGAVSPASVSRTARDCHPSFVEPHRDGHN